MSDQTLYPSNLIDGFQSGCLMDLRVRLAVELLKSPMFHGVEHVTQTSDMTLSRAKTFATFALDVATELLSLAESRGLIEPLPSDDGELGPQVRDQAKRIGSFQVLQQIEGQKFAADEHGKVVPAAPQFRPPGGGRAN